MMNRVGAAQNAHLSEKGNTCVTINVGNVSAKKLAAAQRMLDVSTLLAASAHRRSTAMVLFSCGVEGSHSRSFQAEIPKQRRTMVHGTRALLSSLPLQADESTDALIMEHMRDVSRLCHNLDIPEAGPVRERAVGLLAAMRRKKVKGDSRVHKREAVAVYAIFEACAAMGTPRSLAMLCGVAGIPKKEFTQAKKLVQQHLTEAEREEALQRRVARMYGCDLWMSRLALYCLDLDGVEIRNHRGRNVAPERLCAVVEPYAGRLHASNQVEGRNPDVISAALVLLGCQILDFGHVTFTEVLLSLPEALIDR